MRIPDLSWDHRNNVARIDVSFANRIWHRVEIDDSLILGYNACGRLARVVVLDAAATLPACGSVADAIWAVRAIAAPAVGQADLDVLDSAHSRAVHQHETGRR